MNSRKHGGWWFPEHHPGWWVTRKLPRLERALYLLVGRRGQGKTLLATAIALERMRSGERVYANYSITDWKNGLRAGRVYSLLDLLDLEDCSVIIDEANLWADSRSWSLVPLDVRSRWAQSRHFGLSLVFTSQHEDRVDIILRQLVDWVVVCERLPFVPARFPAIRTHYTWLEEVEQIRRGVLSKGKIRYLPPDVFAAYDTHEIVDATMIERLGEYAAALKAGRPLPAEAFGARHEPSYWNGSAWVPWDTPRPKRSFFGLGGLPSSPVPSEESE